MPRCHFYKAPVGLGSSRRNVATGRQRSGGTHLASTGVAHGLRRRAYPPDADRPDDVDPSDDLGIAEDRPLADDPTPASDVSPLGDTPSGGPPVRRHPILRWLGYFTLGLVLLILALGAAATWYAGEPLRREMERRVNEAMDGYTVTIGAVALHPWNLGLDLQEVTVVQNAQPDPPVIYLPSWETHLDWRALLSFALVARAEMTRPEIYVVASQAAAEAKDKKKLQERGWQDAVTAVYPLEINSFAVTDGTVTYYALEPLEPVTLEDFDLLIQNIRNVRSVKGELPSPIDVHARVKKGGEITVDGKGDLLAEPNTAGSVDYDVDAVSVGYLAPLAKPFNVVLEGGTIATNGHISWAGDEQTVKIEDVMLADAKIEYRVERATEAEDEARLDKAKRATTTSEANPKTRVDVERAQLRDVRLGYLDGASDPPYRLFFTGVGADVRGFSNQKSERAGSAKLTGRFMGSGKTDIGATFRGGGGPDFDVKTQIERVDLTSMNDLLRAKGGFDVHRGYLSVFSEIAVQKGRVDGYVKPLFFELDVYDRQQEKGKNILEKAYEGIVGGVATILENRQRDQVATQTDLSGPVESPKSSTLEIILNLLKNAFIKAIMPGLNPAKS